MPLGEVVRSLANSSPKNFREICPRPTLLQIPAEVLGNVRPITPDTPGYLAAKLARERVRVLRLKLNLDFEQARLHFIGGSRVSVGRSPKSSDIVLHTSRSVSRLHAWLYERVDGWQIADDGSTHGTSVEGTKLKPKVKAILVGGQVIQFAAVSCMFLTPPQLRELALTMVKGDREADEPVAPKPLAIDAVAEGERVSMFVARAAETDGYLDLISSCASPFFIQIPVAALEVDDGRGSMSETQADGEDIIEHTQAISLTKLKEMQRTRKGMDAFVHVLAARSGQAQVVIGRDAECDVVLDETTVSTEHAVIYKGRDGTWRVVDTESANGTYVNGTRLPTGLKMHLKGGEQLWFAGYRGLFLLPKKFRQMLEFNVKKRAK